MSGGAKKDRSKSQAWRLTLGITMAGTAAACTHTAVDPAGAQFRTREALPQLPPSWQNDPAQHDPTKPLQVQAGWVDRLSDPVLSRLVAEAQAANPDILQLAAAVDQSRALARQSRSQLYPFIGLRAGGLKAGNLDGGSVPDEFTFGAEASWEADLWGRINASVSQAEASLAATEADYVFAQYTLAAAVAQSYFAIVEAEQQSQIAEELVVVLEEIYRIASVRLRAGYATSQDTALAQRDLENARAQAALASISIRDATRSLEVLLGRYPSAQLNADSTFPELPAPPPAGLPSQLLERRPDVVSSERRVAASIAGVNQGRAARLPRLSLTGSIGGASDELGNITNPANVIWHLAANILTPLLDAGRLEARVAEAEAAQDQAVAQYVSTALAAFQEVESALDGQLNERRRAAILLNANAASERALHIARLRYNEGEEDLLDVLTIQQATFQSRSALVAIKRSQLDNYIELSLALGGGWSQN